MDGLIELDRAQAGAGLPEMEGATAQQREYPVLIRVKAARIVIAVLAGIRAIDDFGQQHAGTDAVHISGAVHQKPRAIGARLELCGSW